MKTHFCPEHLGIIRFLDNTPMIFRDGGNPPISEPGHDGPTEPCRNGCREYRKHTFGAEIFQHVLLCLTVLLGPTAFYVPGTQCMTGHEVAGIRVRDSGFGMGRISARFRVSIKDQQTKRCLKVELIDAPGLWGERRYRLRLNGRAPAQVKEATLTEIFDRLRRWVVKRTE